MELTVKFTLDDSWEAYHATDEQRLKALLRHDLDGVKAEIIEAKGFDRDERNGCPDNLIRVDEFGELHRAPKMSIPCDICKYANDYKTRACSKCNADNPLNSYYKK